MGLKVYCAVITLAVLLCVVPLSSQARWIPIGPSGGDVRSLAYDPHNPSRVLLGTSAGQMYASADFGHTWERGERLGSDYVLDNIEFDPADSNTVFVAGWSVENPSSNGDLFRSRDGGKTWQYLPEMHGKSIRALAIAKSDHRVLVAGALDGVFRSLDSGQHWQRLSPEANLEIKNVESVAIDPRDPNTVYAGTWHLAWKTTDGGATWHSVRKGVIDDSDVFSIIVDRKDSSVVYLSACSGIYKSESAAEQFSKIQGIPFSARRTRILQQDPNDNKTVYAGTTEGLWKTSDAGKTWKRLTNQNIIVNDVLVDPLNSERVLIATDRSGVWASSDGGQSFVPANTGFSHRQVTSVLVDRNDPATIYAGIVNDKEFGGIFTTRDRGDNWTQITDGLAGQDVFTLAQAEDGTLLAGTNRSIYGMARGSNVWRPMNAIFHAREVKISGTSSGAGLRMQAIKTELTARVSQIEVAAGAWFAATSDGLYRSTDRGRSWAGGEIRGQRNFVSVQSIGSLLVAATPNSVLLSRDNGLNWIIPTLPSYVTAVYGATADPHSIWVATREGALRSPDSGATWEHVLSGLPARQVSAIQYERETGVLHATSLTGELFESTDSGKSWRRIDDGWIVRSVVAGDGRLVAITAFDGLLVMRQEPGESGSAEAAGHSLR